LARPLAGELECGLVRLGPRVTEEGAVGEGTRHQLLGEPLAGLAAVEVGNVDEAGGEGALESHPDDGMIVAERVHADPGHEVEIPCPVFRDELDRKSTRLNSSHVKISYAVFCLKKKKKTQNKN